MANLIRRRHEASEPVSMARRRDPIDLIRDILRFDPYAEMESFVPSALGMEGGFMPNIEVKETKDAYVFRVDLPGVRGTDLDVSITGNRLTISGKREQEEEQEGERYYAFERSFGTFNRSFTLPEGADLEKVDAKLEDGVLQISVPKVAHVQAKKVIVADKQRAIEVEKEPQPKPEGAPQTKAQPEAKAEPKKEPKAA